jgi:nitroreductase
MVVIACVPTTSNPRVVRSEEEFATAAAAHTFMLALTSAGVDSLLTTGDLAQSEEVRELVRMEGSDGKLMGVINVGYRDAERPLMARPAPDPTMATTWYTSE